MVRSRHTIVAILGLAAALWASPAVAQERGEVHGDVVEALQVVSEEILELERIDRIELSDLTIVDVGERVDERRREALADAIAERSDELERLRDEIGLSPLEIVGVAGDGSPVSLERALANLGVDVRDVVALEVEADTVVVYTWDVESIPRVLD
ncbi:MAG: hypothetical protein R3199_04185 [Gemmatimonadota bacterium]|nr:hypothetical protein [Gemmatimonadota bacterium]